MVTIGLILGIVSLVLCWWGWFSLVTMILATAGIILCVIGLKKSEKKGQAIAGIVIGIIALVFSVSVFYCCGYAALRLQCLSNELRDATNELKGLFN